VVLVEEGLVRMCGNLTKCGNLEMRGSESIGEFLPYFFFKIKFGGVEDEEECCASLFNGLFQV